MVRPPAAASTEAAAEAVIDGWRVTRLVTQVASATRDVAAAAQRHGHPRIQRVARRVGDADQVEARLLAQPRHALPCTPACTARRRSRSAWSRATACPADSRVCRAGACPRPGQGRAPRSARRDVVSWTRLLRRAIGHGGPGYRPWRRRGSSRGPCRRTSSRRAITLSRGTRRGSTALPPAPAHRHVHCIPDLDVGVGQQPLTQPKPLTVAPLPGSW